MTRREFEDLVAQAIKGLPPELRSRLDNVVITVKASPTAAQRRRFGPGLRGLYEGVPAPDRASGYSGVMPDKITLFRDNLDAGPGRERRTAGRVRHTLMHEIAHHFGMGDDELLEKGLY